MESWTKKFNELKKYFLDRDSNLLDDLRLTFNCDSAFHLSVKQNYSNFNAVTINQSSVFSNRINGYFFSHIPFELNVVNNNHLYKFNRWSDGVKELNRKIDLSANLELEAVFSHLPSSIRKDSISIRRCYLNYSKKQNLCFIELFNNNDNPVSLKGIRLYEDVNHIDLDLSEYKIDGKSSIILTNNLELFKESLTDKSIKSYPFDLNNSYWTQIKLNLVDTITNSWIDSLHVEVSDSMLIVHQGYLFDKEKGKVNVKALSLSKLKQLMFDKSVKNQKGEMINYLNVLLIAGVLLLILILYFFFKKRKSKNLLMMISTIIIFSTACNGQVEKDTVDSKNLDAVKSNCETQSSVLKRSIDNLGCGEQSLLGTRNFRTVFPGLLYRGGGNNLDLKDSIPKFYVQNPLPSYALTNLSNAGFNKIYYLYSKNFNERYDSLKIDSLKKSFSLSKKALVFK